VQTSDRYTLGVGDGWRAIYARGPVEVLDALRRLPDVRPFQAGLLLPARREIILAAEALAAPDEVTERYQSLRARVLRPVLTPETRDAVTRAERSALRPLLPHQSEFVAFAAGLDGVLNTSEQGTGKTTMALAALRAWDSRRALVVCGQRYAEQWREDLQALYGEGGVSGNVLLNLAQGRIDWRQETLRWSRDELAAYRSLTVVNYEVVEALEPLLRRLPFDAIVADESWKIKGHSSDRSRALRKIAAHHRKRAGARALALTGTPIGQHAGDLWAQVDLVRPDLSAGGYHAWLRRFAELQPQHLGVRTVMKPVGTRDLAGLMAHVGPVWFRATKATCTDLPPKVREVVRLEPSRAVLDLYRAVERDGERALGGDPLTLPNAAVRDLRLHQITGGVHPLTGEPLTSTKIEWLLQWALDELLPYPNVRALVWCAYNGEVAYVRNMLGDLLGSGRVEGVTGSDGPFGHSPSALKQIKAHFNDRRSAGPQVLVCQVAAMAEGHNLQAGDWNVYHSNPWSYILRAQSEDRTHRLGREGGVRYIDLVCSGLIDERVSETLARREDFAARLGVDTTTG
jgi:SNF2 family DNA or RNA helicase